MKKLIIRLLVLTMLFSILPNFELTQASINSNNETDVIEVEKEIKEDFGIEVAEQLNLDVKKEDNLVVVKTNLDTTDVKVTTEMEYNIDTEAILLDGTVEENGEKVNQKFEVILHEVEENSNEFSATFIDQDTGEIYDMNTIEAQASALPLVIIAVVARYGITYAIKKYGKSAVNSAVKSKSFGQVLSSVSKLDANKRNHIMQAKHDWYKVTNNNWNDVSKVISHVMRYGSESAYGSARKKTLNMNGKTVTVTFKRINGDIRISDAWVNK
ncbi:MafB-like protein [Bacillus cereus]|uniref:MafB-like protein n=1 Tax=Bacillus cereus TaxID=1396 RepID=A0A9X6UDJ1_BACCE|nr:MULTISPECIES: SAR2788 family putative toxin [Bacillus cereus group]PEO00037.1 MafB-like protein [Bacillus cereus]